MYSMISFYWFNYVEKKEKVPDIFLLDIFELRKMQVLQKFWLHYWTGDCLMDRCVNVSVSESHAVSQIRSFFYYDKKNNQVIPMIDMPGLKVMHCPELEGSLYEKLYWLIKASVTIPSSTKPMAIASIKNTEKFLQISSYYQLSMEVDDSIRLDLPKPTDTLEYVVVDGESLFSQNDYSDFILSNLWFCVGSKMHPSYPEYSPKYIILQQVTLKPKMDAILRKYGDYAVEEFYTGMEPKRRADFSIYPPDSPRYSPDSPQYSPTSPVYDDTTMYWQ